MRALSARSEVLSEDEDWYGGEEGVDEKSEERMVGGRSIGECIREREIDVLLSWIYYLTPNAAGKRLVRIHSLLAWR